MTNGRYNGIKILLEDLAHDGRLSIGERIHKIEDVISMANSERDLLFIAQQVEDGRDVKE